MYYVLIKYIVEYYQTCMEKYYSLINLVYTK